MIDRSESGSGGPTPRESAPTSLRSGASQSGEAERVPGPVSEHFNWPHEVRIAGALPLGTMRRIFLAARENRRRYSEQHEPVAPGEPLWRTLLLIAWCAFWALMAMLYIFGWPAASPTMLVPPVEFTPRP